MTESDDLVRLEDLADKEPPVRISQFEAQNLQEDIKRKQLENLVHAEHLESLTQDRKERKKFANKLYWFLLGFILCVVILVFLSGNKCLNFNLSDAVLVTLLTTTSANIIGVFVFVVRYLFNTNKYPEVVAGDLAV